MAITYVRCLFNSSINKYIFMILLFNSHGVISCNTPWTRELLDAICPYAADPLCCSGGCIWAIETSDHQVMSAHPQNLISKQSGPQGGMADHHTIPYQWNHVMTKGRPEEHRWWFTIAWARQLQGHFSRCHFTADLCIWLFADWEGGI